MSTTAIERLLRSHGFDLARQKKHKVYKRDDGTTFVTASTPSDRRAEQKQLSTLCRVLGMDKRSLLASLERRRRRVRAVIVPAAMPKIGPPPLPVEKSPTREEKKLAKRLGRIERNRAAKAARGADRLDLFFERPAVLFVDSGEIMFTDNRGMRLLWKTLTRRIERPRTSAVPLSDRYGTGTDVTAEEILTNPDLLCLYNCPRCGVSFVFKDGSLVDGNPTAVELRDELKANVNAHRR